MKNIHKFIILVFLGLGYFNACQSNQSERTVAPRPNILFAISDDQSFPHAGAYGCTWVKTPNFDRVANEGLLFNQAYTPNAKCSPSRACILTGRNSWQLEAAGNHVPFFPEKFKTFPETLADNGYTVGYTGKGWAPGVATKNGEPRDLIGKAFQNHKLTPPTTAISNIDYAANFTQFLTEKRDDTPFFFWYGAKEPHRVYEFQSGIKEGGKKLNEVTEVPPFWPDNDSVRIDMLDYAFEVEHFDNHLGKMLQQLEEIGELENTIVIVTADNGMPFPRIKGQIYQYDNHLPLAIRWGRGIENKGRTIEDYVNFIDFAPTFLEVAKITPVQSGMQAVSGKSLLEIFNSSKSGKVTDGRNYVLIGKERHDIGRPKDEGYPVRGIIQGNLAYTINFKPERWPAGNPETGYLNTDGSPTKTVILNERRRLGKSKYWDLNFGKRPKEELYDIKNDPFCMNNLANAQSLAAKKSEMNALLIAELKNQGDPRVLGDGDIFDNYEYAHPSTKGFYERFKDGEKMKTGWVNPSDYEREGDTKLRLKVQ